MLPFLQQHFPARFLFTPGSSHSLLDRVLDAVSASSLGIRLGLPSLSLRPHPTKLTLPPFEDSPQQRRLGVLGGQVQKAAQILGRAAVCVRP